MFMRASMFPDPPGFPRTNAEGSLRACPAGIRRRQAACISLLGCVLLQASNRAVASFSSRLQATTASERWSLANATAMLLAAGGAFWFHSSGPLLFVGVAMLGLLVVSHRGDWTPSGPFGGANGVTAFRAGLLCLLPSAIAIGPTVLIGVSLLILSLDALDGWLARRHALSSEFGAFFDKETDALFLLLLCGLAAFRDFLPTWILGAGLLRYGFVVGLFLLPTPQKTEARSRAARYVYGGMVGALLVSFLPYPSVSYPLVLAATGALLVSFGHSAWWIATQRWA